MTTVEDELEVLKRLCADPLITLDEARGRVGEVFVGSAEAKDDVQRDSPRAVRLSSRIRIGVPMPRIKDADDERG